MGNPFMVFDVESIGLHGEGFAVGYVVVRQDGVILDHGYEACPSHDAAGEPDGRAWVEANVDPRLPPPTCSTPFAVRERFWRVWELWQKQGALLAADVAWPVEARFLARCVRNFGGAAGPYPLIDVASVRLARGFHPLATCPRRPDELPAHNPLNDARQSARLLLEALRPA